MCKLYIAWNSDKSEGVIFTKRRDAESALDGKHWIDPEIGFPSISSLAEAFSEIYDEGDAVIEAVTITSAGDE